MNIADLPRCEQLVDVKDRLIGVNCGACTKLGDFKKEKQAGFCLVFRRMQSTWHQVRCNRFARKE